MLGRTAPTLLGYSFVARSTSMRTSFTRHDADRMNEYITQGSHHQRKWSYVTRQQRPWWKEMPKYKQANMVRHWFEPLPHANYLVCKADGLYTLPRHQTITLQHVHHLKMFPVGVLGRTFTMPLVRWLVGANVKYIVGGGQVKEEPVYKLTKPKYWVKQ